MFSFSNAFLIARREYLERVRAKSFMVMTVLIPALMGGAIFALVLVNKHQKPTQHVAVITSDPTLANDLQLELTSPDATVKPVVDAYPLGDAGMRAKLDEQLKSKDSDLDGYLVVTPAATAGERPTFQWMPRVTSDVVTRAHIADAARGALIRSKLAASGMSASQIESLMASVDLSAGNKQGDQSGNSMKSAWAMYFLMYFIILFYGMNVARSIIEEKTSRIFEVLLATIKPDEMLFGKVVGVGAVGLTQVGIWLVVAVAAAKANMAGLDVQLLPNPMQCVMFAVFFLLGFLLYASLAAALGAMNNSEQELQQMQIFLMLPLIFSSMIIFSVITNPDGIVSKIGSFFPFTSPLIMYTRVVVKTPSVAEIAGSLAVLVVTIAVVLWLASRIYRVGILMYGKKPNLPEILRWMKYS